MNRRIIAVAALAAAALLPNSAHAATYVDDPDYGHVEVQADGGLLIPVRGRYSVMYRTPVRVDPLAGETPAPVIRRYDENTVAPTPEEVASNPFLRGY